MATTSIISLLLFVLLLFNRSLGREEWQPQNECQLDKLDALKPDNRVKSEAGTMESWNPDHKQLKCAGVAFVRRTVEPNGLLLPSYSNSPQLVYIIQGKGIMEILLSGCPETYQESQESQRGQRKGTLRDQHQKIQHFREGDIIAIPAGVAHWCYNDGEEQVIAISIMDTSNTANQLDMSPRQFYLAGNPEEEFSGEQRERREQRGESGEKESSCSNMLCGMDTKLISEAFNVDENVARKLQNHYDQRGSIVRVKGGLQVLRPSRTEEREHRGRDNGLEETLCTMRMRENIGDPTRADVYSQGAGRISTINSNKLPILRILQLGASHGLLHDEAVLLPHWSPNSHGVLYAIRGQARIQVVNERGKALYDSEVNEGQVLTVPQNFAMVAKAARGGFEWICFKTNDHAMVSALAGRTSAIRAMPAEVLANAYRMSMEDAMKIKFGTPETTLRAPRSQPGRIGIV